jgi:transcriptional regulator with XRE-family HTH domain
MSITERVKKLCKEHDTSIPALEKNLGFSNGSIYKWDTNTPNIDRVQRVAGYFGVTIEFLLHGMDKREPFNKQTILKLAKDNGMSIGQVIAVLEEVRSTILDEKTV